MVAGLLSLMYSCIPSVMSKIVGRLQNMDCENSQITCDHFLGFYSLLNIRGMAKDELSTIYDLDESIVDLLKNSDDDVRYLFLFAHEDGWVREKYIAEIRDLLSQGKNAITSSH